VLAPGTLHSTLTSQGGDCQKGEMNLARGRNKGNNGLDRAAPEPYHTHLTHDQEATASDCCLR